SSSSDQRPKIMLKALTRRNQIAVKAGDPPPQPVGRTLKRLFSYLRPYRGRMTATIGVYMVCVTISNFYPFIDRILIDRYISVGQVGRDFMILIGVAAVLHAVNYLGVGVRSLAIVRISQNLLFDLRRQLFRHVEHLSFAFHESWPV